MRAIPRHGSAGRARNQMAGAEGRNRRLMSGLLVALALSLQATALSGKEKVGWPISFRLAQR